MTDPCRTGRALESYARTHLLLLLSALAALAFADRAFAEARQINGEPVEFNIPAQFVPAALSEFARQARVQLFFISDGFEDIRANAVVGTYSTQEALDLLLAGTGLAASISSESGVKVRLASASMNSLFLGSQSLTAAAADSGDGRYASKQSNSQSQWIVQGSARNREEAARHIEEVLVTGSRIRGAGSASPIVSITRQEIDRAGFATVAEIIEELPQNFGAGASLDALANSSFINDAVGGRVDNFVGGTSVNLRGLGASSTLVLLNGRRMSASGRSARFTDISGIPVSAIERVEVLTDGASAIYGSDAIGGVINFILRDDYQGAETRLRYGSDTSGDTSEVLFGQAFGTSWDDGSLLLSFEYFHHDNLANRDRSFAASNDLTRFGGDDFRTPGGNPANIEAGGQIFAIPAGQDGTSLTPTDFPVDANDVPIAPPNLFSSLENSDMLPEQERHSVFLSLSQSVGAAELFSDVRFSASESEFSQSIVTEDFDVPDTNPFFVDPTGTGLTTVRVSNYLFSDDLGPTRVSGEKDSYGVALGVRFDISDNWKGELAGNWTTEEMRAGDGNFVDRNALVDALSQTDPNLAFNPFGDGSHTNPAVIESLRSSGSGRDFVRSENELTEVSFNVDSGVLNRPGGPVQVAAGIEYREESLSALDGSSRSTTPLESAIDSSRDVLAVYAELLFPIVSFDNGRPGLQHLELSVAGRYEDYSDFGDTTNPKLGLMWSPMQSLALRAAWGTSFRAPAMYDLNVDSAANSFIYLPQFFVDLGLIPFPALVLQGANENLQAEEATTWTAGLEWTPVTVDGLSLDVTYFNVDFENRIDTPVDIINGFADPRFASLVNTMPTSDQLAAIANDPRYQESTFGFTTPSSDILSGSVAVGGILDRRKTNLSQSVLTGVDLQLSYAIETSSFGAFDIGLNANYLFDFERRFVKADPLVDEVDTLGRPVDFRARGSMTWSHGAWSVSGFLNYMDGYTDNVSDPARSVDPWTTMDLTIAYDTGEAGMSGLLHDTRLSLTTQNLFDEDPPFVNNQGLSYDLANANGLGRFVAFQVTKAW